MAFRRKTPKHEWHWILPKFNIADEVEFAVNGLLEHLFYINVKKRMAIRTLIYFNLRIENKCIESEQIKTHLHMA